METRGDALLLGLFSLARSGEYEKGWELLESHPECRRKSLETYYVGCYLAYQRGDYENTHTWGEQYLSEHENASEENMKYDVFSKLHEILNTLGCASKDEGKHAQALEYLDSAIAFAELWFTGLSKARYCRDPQELPNVIEECAARARDEAADEAILKFALENSVDGMLGDPKLIPWVDFDENANQLARLVSAYLKKLAEA